MTALRSASRQTLIVWGLFAVMLATVLLSTLASTTATQPSASSDAQTQPAAADLHLAQDLPGDGDEPAILGTFADERANQPYLPVQRWNPKLHCNSEARAGQAHIDCLGTRLVNAVYTGVWGLWQVTFVCVALAGQAPSAIIRFLGTAMNGMFVLLAGSSFSRVRILVGLFVLAGIAWSIATRGITPAPMRKAMIFLLPVLMLQGFMFTITGTEDGTTSDGLDGGRGVEAAGSPAWLAHQASELVAWAGSAGDLQSRSDQVLQTVGSNLTNRLGDGQCLRYTRLLANRYGDQVESTGGHRAGQRSVEMATAVSGMYQQSVLGLWSRQQYGTMTVSGGVENAWCGQLEQYAAGRAYGAWTHDSRGDDDDLMPIEQTHYDLASQVGGAPHDNTVVLGVDPVYGRSGVMFSGVGEDVRDVHLGRVCGGLSGSDDTECAAVEAAERNNFERPTFDLFAALLMILSALTYMLLFGWIALVSLFAAVFGVLLVFLLPATLTILAIPTAGKGGGFNKTGVKMLRATLGMVVLGSLGQIVLTIAMIIMSVLDLVFKGLF